MATKTTKANFDQRFWSKIDKTESCWLWTAATYPHGYGKFCFFGKDTRAHRVMWHLTHGPIPEGMDILHTCDNPSCVNPAHLFLGTHADNMQDMVAKGRHGMWTKPESKATGMRCGCHTHPESRARGERHGSRTHPERVIRGEQYWSARLTENDVRSIRQRYAEGDSVTVMAREYGISRNSIYRVLRRRNWKHVE